MPIPEDVASMPRPKYSDLQVRKRLGRQIQAARKARGWTREHLAEALKLAVQTVWKYETANLSLSATMLYRIADVLGLPVEALLTDAAPTRTEAELLAAWRQLEEKEREMVLYLAKRLSEGPPRPSSEGAVSS